MHLDTGDAFLFLFFTGFKAGAITLDLKDVHTLFPGIYAFTGIKFEYKAVECATDHFTVAHNCASADKVAVLMWTQTLDTVVVISVFKNYDVFTVDRTRYWKFSRLRVDLLEIMPLTFTHYQVA
jgi:hypothetical protein